MGICGSKTKVKGGGDSGSPPPPAEHEDEVPVEPKVH
jgi:hypothetical protein